MKKDELILEGKRLLNKIIVRDIYHFEGISPQEILEDNDLDDLILWLKNVNSFTLTLKNKKINELINDLWVHNKNRVNKSNINYIIELLELPDEI